MGESKDSFERIIDQFGRQVFNTCLGFLKDPDEAKDVAQEVFIQAYQSIDTFRGDSEISTWLYRISVNKCLENQRKWQRSKRTHHKVDITEAQAVGSTYYHPGIHLENKERSNILLSKMDELPESQKIAFTLNKIDGLSANEIAKVLGKSPASIESLLNRAKTNLKKLLKEYYEEH